MADKKKFEPIKHYKKDKDGKIVLDKNGVKIKLDAFRSTTFQEMCDFLKENGTKEEKEAFKKACYTRKVYEEVVGKRGGVKRVPTNETVDTDTINVMYAKEWFFKQFAPEYLPQKKEEEKTKTMEDMLAEL